MTDETYTTFLHIVSVLNIEGMILLREPSLVYLPIAI